VKIAVLVKRVPDTASVFKIAADGKGIVEEGLKFVMSPYDEHAVEEAIKLKEAGLATEVVVISLGPEGCKEIIRTALAMGADSGVHLKVDGTPTSRGASHALAGAVGDVGAQLVLAGKQAVDGDASQTAERVAERLNWAHVSVVTRLVVADGGIEADREVEGGFFTVKAALPAVVSIQKGINTPRYPTLPNIMKAKKKEIVEFPLMALPADHPMLHGAVVETLSLPRSERLGRVLSGSAAEQAAALVKTLREEEKVL
jgi:electron transfer flavoprotein beta subunit